MQIFRLGLSALLVFLFPLGAFAQTPAPRYSFHIRVDPVQKTVSGQERVVFVNPGASPLAELFFHVYPNRSYSRREQALLLRYAGYFKTDFFPEGFPSALMTVHAVKAEGQTLPFEWKGDDHTLLRIALPRPLAPGESVAVDLDFDLKIPHAYSRFGWHRGIMKLSQWYPRLAVYDGQAWHAYPFYPFHRPFFSDASYYAVTLTVPQEQQVAHSGILTKETQNSDGTKILEITTPQPIRDFTFALSADYRVVDGKQDGILIHSFYLPGDEAAARQALTNAAELMQRYRQWFGPYPYSEFSVVPVPLGYGGEQMSNLVFIDDRAYRLPGFLRRYFDFLVSHETGHQWIYNTVGVDEYTQMWVEEGLNSYLILKYLEGKYGPQADVLDYPHWAQPAKWLFPRLTFSQTRDYLYKRMVRIGYERQPVLSELSRFREPSSIFSLAYGKGARVFGMLENYLGSEAFDRVLQRIWNEYAFKNLDVKDLERICAEEKGEDLSWFFDPWLRTTGYLDDAVAGVRRGAVILEHRGEIRMPVPVRVRFADSQERSFVWKGQKDREEVTVNVPSAVREVAIDPDGRWLDIDRTNNFWPRKLNVRPVPFYWGLYDMPVFLPEDGYNLVFGPETGDAGPGVKVSLQKPYDQTVYGATDYDWNDQLQRTRAGYLLRNVLHRPMALGAEFFNTTDYDDGREDLTGGKLFLRHELWPAPYGFSEMNDHVTMYLVHNQRLGDHPQFLEYREGDHSLEYSRRKESLVGLALKWGNNGPYPDPKQGYQIYAWAENAGHFFGATQSFYRNAVDLSVYQPVTAQSRLAGRIKAGWGYPDDKDLFQLGGSYDLRGYDYKSFRGAKMLLGSGEYRFPLWKNVNMAAADHLVGLEEINGVAFFDGGTAWYETFGDAKWRSDVGGGLRFTVNFGSLLEKVVLRFDVAQPLREPEDGVHFWFGFNHAF